MASNQTPTYGLNQWSLEDQVIMAEFNADNAKIEQALLDLKASFPKFETGTFSITETHDQTNPHSITFGFEPQLVILLQSDLQASNFGPTILVRGMPTMVGIYNYKNYNTYEPKPFYLTWEGNTLTWCSAYPIPQATFYYMAIG